MLSRKNFKAADEETARIMLWVARREKEDYLPEEDIKKFPCRDLLTIDQLWLASSGGKFGFSVQKQIWIKCGGKLGQHDNETMVKFAECVEWKVGDKWVSDQNLCWELRAPRGHLPGITYSGITLPSRPIRQIFWEVGYEILRGDIDKVVDNWKIYLGSRKRNELKEKYFEYFKGNKRYQSRSDYRLSILFNRAATCKL
jgi:hypothetical protein